MGFFVRKLLRIFILPLGMLAALPAWAADSDLDAAFSVDGHLHTDFGMGNHELLGSILLQPDGRLIAAGYQTDNISSYGGVVARYLPSGEFDNEFGTGGRVELAHTEDGLDLLLMTTAALHADGKIVVAGVLTNATTDDFRTVLVRLNADGSLDTNFGEGGYVTHSVSSYALLPHRMQVLPGGKYLLTGDAIGASRRVFAARLNADGSFDAAFGNDGYSLVQASIGDDHFATALGVQQDGKIVIAGDYDDGTGGDIDSFILRLDTAGNLDTGFSGDGVIVKDYLAAGTDGFNAVLPAVDGSLFAIGDTGGATADSHSLIVKFNADGSLDTGFGTGGERLLTEIAERDYTGGGVILPDGRLLLAGELGLGDPDNTTQPMVMRLEADGALDTTFNTTGYRVYDIAPAGGIASFYRAHYLPGGRIALAGNYQDNSAGDSDLMVGVLTGHAYDLEPQAFSFTDESDVDEGVLVTSGVIEVEGIAAGLPVAVGVSGGEYRIGSGEWTDVPGFARAGDQIAVRHTSASAPGTTIDTMLTVGGFHSVSNPNVMLGDNRSDTFSSTSKSATGGGGTTVPSGGGGGGGSTGWMLLAILGLLARVLRVRGGPI